MMPLPMQSTDRKHLVPDVEWISCGHSLPDAGHFVWVCVGRVIESGVARRYERQVHMGVYKNDLQFQIFPFGNVCSNEVWAWAPIIPPERPVVRPRKATGEQYEDDFDDRSDDDEPEDCEGEAEA
jgi:hypothetical protein